MIITKLKGGIGNQMFQYATGFALALKNKTEHKIDISGYDKNSSDTPRKFSLNIFNITSPIALSEEIIVAKSNTVWSKFDSFIKQKIFRKYYLDFHPDLFKKISTKIKNGQDFYLDGNLQSEKNFIEFSKQIIKEFTFKKEFFSEKVNQLAEVIQKENTVSIHIRRGDYVNDKKTNQYHGTCPIEYYKKAVKLIEAKIVQQKNNTRNQITFYIFTDDEKWVTENFTFVPNYINISKNHFKDYEDLFLMSQCQHQIIANSSFSWWGAWLNKNSDKIVIAPENWVNKKPNPHPNIIPETWTKI